MPHSAFDCDHSCFKQLFESSPDPCWIIDGDRLVDCNDAAVMVLGYPSREQLSNVHPAKLSPPNQADGEDSAEKAERMLAAARKKGSHRFEWLHSRADGSKLDAEVTLSVIDLKDRQLIYCVSRDITERKKTDKALRESEKHIRVLFNSGNDPLFVYEADSLSGAPLGCFVEVNDMACFRLGYSREKLLRMRPDEILADEAARHPPPNVKLAFNREAVYETFHRTHDGQVIPVEVNAHMFELYDKALIFAMARDITERKQSEQRVHHLAFYDALTNLPNRRLLTDRLNQAMAASKRCNCYGAVIFLDLDNFKPINDTYGHVVGDALLVEAADRLKNCVREMDTVARFGGDEFVVILSDLTADKAESALQVGLIADKIRSSLSEPYLLTLKQEGTAETITHHCTASIGVALFVDHEASQHEILKWADSAMYQAKESGRNSIRFYGATMSATA